MGQYRVQCTTTARVEHLSIAGRETRACIDELESANGNQWIVDGKHDGNV